MKTETINDIDGFVANFWRAVKNDSRNLAEQINWPVNEVDMEARHRYLCRMPEKVEFLERMKHEPDYYDVKRAAWWCWGLCAWIGSGWCGDDGRGVHRQLPHLGNDGRGVHRQLPHLGDDGMGEDSRRLENILSYIQALADRLRNVRVCCGDWKRTCTDGATTYGKTMGVFLDPPYAGSVGRRKDIYRCENLTVSDEVRQWCHEKTDDHRFRVVLAGYEGEHDVLEADGWEVFAWKAGGGFANSGKEKQGKKNTHRERLWFSPSCRRGEDRGEFDFM